MHRDVQRTFVLKDHTRRRKIIKRRFRLSMKSSPWFSPSSLSAKNRGTHAPRSSAGKFIARAFPSACIYRRVVEFAVVDESLPTSGALRNRYSVDLRMSALQSVVNVPYVRTGSAFLMKRKCSVKLLHLLWMNTQRPMRI